MTEQAKSRPVFIKMLPFDFIGKGKVLKEGVEIEAELKFKGHLGEVSEGVIGDNSKITFELIRNEDLSMWTFTTFDKDKI